MSAGLVPALTLLAQSVVPPQHPPPPRSCHHLYGVDRLADGSSLSTAAANVASIAKALERQYPDSNRDQAATLVDLTEVVVGSVRPILWLLLGDAALLMVISSLNVAGRPVEAVRAE